MSRMVSVNLNSLHLQLLRSIFGERLKTEVPLARYTSARVGGPADAFLPVDSASELAETVRRLWELEIPFMVLGGGSNVLVSDAGIRAVVLHNRARAIEFSGEVDPPGVWAESGANFGMAARLAAGRGLAGLEWAAGIPGTVGGAVVGNAGAHGGDVAGNLIMAEILHRESVATGKKGSDIPDRYRREEWPVERLEFAYRSSSLKRQKMAAAEGVQQPTKNQPGSVVLSARFRLQRSTAEVIKNKMDSFVAYRRQTQPPGASMGSMFKNPAGDFAGRLIEAAGLKGTRAGAAEISRLHANFFINHGDARAEEVWELIRLAHQAVARQFGVNLEREIELVGEWNEDYEGR